MDIFFLFYSMKFYFNEKVKKKTLKIKLLFKVRNNIYLLFFRLWWSRRIELDEILFGLDAILFDWRLLLLMCWMAFSLGPCALLLTITRDAPSNRSFKLSPTIRKFGNRIQHVFTVHDPDIPWHLHSWRISLWTCCEKRRKKKTFHKSHSKRFFITRWNC